MNSNLITEIIDLNKVKSNLLEVQKLWEKLITTMSAKSTKDLKFDDLAKNLKTVAAAEKELQKTKQAGLEVDKKKVKITAEIIANYESYSKADKKIIENEIKRKHEIKETNKLLKDRFTSEQNLTKVLNQETKSIKDLDKQNKDLQKIQQKLNITTKEGISANSKINAQISKNKEATNLYTNAIDKQRRNVGNYTGATEKQRVALEKIEAQNKRLIIVQAKLNKSTEGGKNANAKIEAQLQKNKKATKEYTEQIRKNKTATDKQGVSAKKMGGSMAVAGAGIMVAFAALKQIGAAFKESIALFVEQEKQAFRVGQAFGSYANKINDAANATQNATTVGNEQYQKLAVLADALGISQDNVNQEVENAIGLSIKYEALGLSQEAAMKNLVLARNGEFTQLQKYIPELKNLNTQTEKMAYLQEAAADGFDIATQYADTFGGKMQQIGNAAGDLKEVFGEQFLTGLVGEAAAGNKAVSGINKLIEALNKTQVISKYLARMREQASMMLEPFHKLMQIFGDGGNAVDGLTKAFDFYFKVMSAIATPVKLIWSALSALVGVIVDLIQPLRNLYTEFKNVDSIGERFQILWEKVKSLKIQDIFNIINKAIVELISPITELVGMSDEVNKFFGQQQENVRLTADEYDRLNMLSGNYVDNVKKAAKEQIVLNETIKQAAEDLEEENKALEGANAAYLSYLKAIKNASEEAKLSIAIGEDVLIARIKESEAIYAASKALFALNGYTTEEIAKLKELKKSTSDLRAEMVQFNDDLELQKKIREEINNLSVNPDEIPKAIVVDNIEFEETIEDIDKVLDRIRVGAIAKIKETFNDLFNVEPVEDWKESFIESTKRVFDESYKLFNDIIDLQNMQLDNELDNLHSIYDKQGEVLESAYDRRKSLIEATIDDETEQAAALALLEDEKLALFEKREDARIAKEQEIAKKRAILEKKQAAVEIAVSSATALVEAVKLISIATTAAAPGDPYSLVARIAAALAAALTVVGAVTAGIAKAKSIEIPQFYAGGEAQEGQLISVAERGREMAIDESGNSYIFDKQSFLIAPEKMRIFSNQETNKIMEKQTINNTYEKSNNVNLTVAIDNERHKKYFKLN